MARIFLIRHGKAAAGFDGHADPGLDPLGRTQAAFAADRMGAEDPMMILSSPLARARETAEPLARMWEKDVIIEPRVSEIPSPTYDLEERAAWLRRAMGGTWAELGDRWARWRDELAECLASLDRDTVVFTHFIAINAAVGHARGEDGLVLFRPDNCSITELANDDGLTVTTLGEEADTEVR